MMGFKVGDIVTICPPTEEQRSQCSWDSVGLDKHIGKTGEVTAVGTRSGKPRVFVNGECWWYPVGVAKLASKFKRNMYYKKLKKDEERTKVPEGGSSQDPGTSNRGGKRENLMG